MDVLITLFYLLFSACVVYPPTEFVTAGFTIEKIFQGYLGSENVNFVDYHIKRTTLTLLIHTLLPFGYVVCIGEISYLFITALIVSLIILLTTSKRIYLWWTNDKKGHPISQILALYAPEGNDWKSMSSNLNIEFRSVDKICIPLTATSKLIATETWIIKVSTYSVNLVRQDDAALVVTATDTHDMTITGESEIQYVRIDVIPGRDDVKKFSFRITTTALRELQPRLLRQVVIPEHITLQPTLIERFANVFRQNVDLNSVYYVDQVQELCIGCMVTRADVKIQRSCIINPDLAEQSCQQCNCRPLWCCVCMARWWASRASTAGTPPDQWLETRCPCPVCRAPFCLLDVHPIVRRGRTSRR